MSSSDSPKAIDLRDLAEVADEQFRGAVASALDTTIEDLADDGDLAKIQIAYGDAAARGSAHEMKAARAALGGYVERRRRGRADALVSQLHGFALGAQRVLAAAARSSSALGAVLLALVLTGCAGLLSTDHNTENTRELVEVVRSYTEAIAVEGAGAGAITESDAEQRIARANDMVERWSAGGMLSSAVAESWLDVPEFVLGSLEVIPDGEQGTETLARLFDDRFRWSHSTVELVTRQLHESLARPDRGLQ